MSLSWRISRSMAKVVVAAVFAALMVIVLHAGSDSVSAQAQSETKHIAVNNCRPVFGGAYTLCEQARGVTHTTQTPSGTRITVLNGQLCQQLKDTSGSSSGSIVRDGCQRVHETYVFRRGEEQVTHITTKGQFTVRGQTCHYWTVYQVANGDVRHVDSDMQCAPAS